MAVVSVHLCWFWLGKGLVLVGRAPSHKKRLPSWEPFHLAYLRELFHYQVCVPSFPVGM